MKEKMRNYSDIDHLIMHVDSMLKTVCGGNSGTRDYPVISSESNLTAAEVKQSIGLMRVNNVGEVCAQALYQGQALASTNIDLALKLQEASDEEIDHLAWTEQRLNELGGRLSYLNLFWYTGSFSLGYIAGVMGDKWSLGFLAETEYQVTYHLEDYMQKLPDADKRSYEVMQAMRDDEIKHAEMAIESGGVELPVWAKSAMQVTASIMKALALRI
ncbi:MAG: 2-polyprenyl-3-methyl-6-methoxy-1,4-benzoquinone monooxygenase [Legionellales bacterium]|nr:2-polyprenyl-3-methyl-6-methoxy-1,4-benzoquinone monooxygenase [Legionellales bacterium]